MKNGKVNIKSIIIIVIILLVGVLSVLLINTVKTYMTGATAGADPKNVLATPGDDGKSATITWTTDKAVEGVVEYGANAANLLLRAPEADATTSHSVALSPLKSGQSYFFRILVGEDVYDNGGIPYSFKTKTVTDTTDAGTADQPIIPTVVPTVALVPTASPVTTGSGTAKCQNGVDYNGDKVINSIDYIYCLKNGTGTAKPPATVTPTKAPVVSGKCVSGVDYNGDKVINSIDYIYCLKNGTGKAVPTAVPTKPAGA